MKAYQTQVAIERILNPLRGLDIPPRIPQGEVTILEDTLGIVDDFGVMLRGVDEFRTLITAQYLDDKKTLDACFEQGKAHFVLIKKGTQVILRDSWPSAARSGLLQVVFHGQRKAGQSGQAGWYDYYLQLPVSALLKEFSHPATYVPKSDDWIISNESQKHWLRNPVPPTPTPVPIAVATPTPASEPEAVPEPSPQPVPTPLPMRLETPTPAPKAPKSRWNTHPEPSAEELAGQDLQKAQSEFDNAWGSFSDEQRALLRQEENGWDAYFASAQDPAIKARGLRERAKYLRECYAYFRYYDEYQKYRAWCQAHGQPVPPPLKESAPAPVPTPTPENADLVEQERAAEQEYRALWNPLTDKQRIALFQEQSQFDSAFRKLRDHGSPADRIKAYKEEIARMKALIAGMTPASDPAEAEKLKQKMAELDAVWNSLPPEQQARVNPGKEGWLVAVRRLPVSDQLRETEARIKFLRENLGQFMRMPGVPPPAEDPALAAQLKQKQAILDGLLNALPDSVRKQYVAGMKIMHDHDATLPIAQRIQYLDVEIRSLEQAAEYLKASK